MFFTCAVIIMRDWKNRESSYRLKMKKLSLRMLANRRMPQISIEKVPIDFYCLIKVY